MLSAQTGVEDYRRIVQGVDALLTKLPGFQSFDMNELVEVTLHTELLLQTRVGIVLGVRAGL